MTHYVQFCGNIGAGKSTLARLFAGHAGFDYVPEPVLDLTFVDDFYLDMPRWSFHHQMEFLLLNAQQERLIASSSRGVCQDRSLAECVFVFAAQCRSHGWISDREWRLLTMAYKLMESAIRRPDLRVLVSAPIPTLMTRIVSRGRPHEANMSVSWLTALDQSYASWISAGSVATLTIDAERFDFANNRKDQAEVISLIENALERS
ncbi:deoxyadenosine/deoxycytidine kinase [Bradyrhizobium macuxiense]|uniref:Deoxyadenosine/deoxycytidine kinase n=1 Tax=Bradyrhizobium macuxiense TaxID=1755647 RepID=A0A560KUA9_9BRAD|nr:deoxynucleoside kinase [Bradyrhizobium macuxiense]TWB86772.1 deoxyadenosine/deoxycytidine kinase [Bradyrhizobium macuxiense]